MTPPFAQARLADGQIFLVRQAGLAKVDLIVDDAGQQMQAGGVDRFIDARLRGRVDIGDARTFDDHGNRLDSRGKDHRAFLISNRMEAVSLQF